MTRCAMVMMVVGVLGIAGAAWAASPYDDANDGNWTADNADTWGQGIGVYPDTAGDAATIDSHRVTWTGVPAGVSITLDGGTIDKYGGNIDQPITIGNSNVAGSVIENTHTYGRMYLTDAAVLSGSGKLTFNCRGTGGDADIWVQSSNPAFSGDVSITGYSVRMSADQALGTGNITADGATLFVAADQTVMPASVLVTNGGTLGTRVNDVPDMTLANGTFMQTEVRLQDLPCSVDLQAGTDNVIYGAGWDKFMEFKTGSISGAGNVTFRTDTDHNGIWLYQANTLSGAVAVQGKVGIKDPGGLGTVSAPLNITAGGLLTDLADSGQSVLHNVAAVNVTDAALILRSTELSTTVITLNAGGGLKINGGSTPLDYTPGTGNVQVYHGAVLDEAFGTTYTAPDPTADEIQGAGAGVQPQVLMGLRRDTAIGETFVVGPGDGGGAGEILWSGISSMNRRMNVSGTVQEYTAGEGFAVNAMSLTAVTIMNSAQFLGSGAAALTGGGTFEMRSGAMSQGGSVPTLNMNAAGELFLSNSDVIPPGATLNINGGWVRTAHTDSINAGGTVNVNEGGVLVMMPNIVGQIHVNGGGGLYNVNTAALAAATMSWDAPEDNPAHLMLAGDCTSLPTDGHYNFILNKDAQNFTSLVLGPDARLYGMNYKDQVSKVVTGEISATGDSARLTARSDGSLWIQSKINLPGKKLIIGDTQAFRTLDGEYRVGGGVYTWEDAPQAGPVVLRNPESGTTPANLNVIGSVEIQAGSLNLDATSALTDVNNLGNAASVDIWAGATLYVNNDNPTMSTIFKGKGAIQITNRPSNHRLYVQPKDLGGSVLAAGFAPGHSGGVLTLKGYLNFRNLDVGGTLYWPQMDIEVLNDGGSAANGDHDQLVVTQDVENLNADLSVIVGVPSVNLVPAGVNATFLTAGGNLSGAFHSVASGLLDAATGLDQTTRERIRDHWDIGADDVVVTGGAGGSVGVVLDAADWTAIPGDADLDGSVLLSDLSTLAFNWESSTGMTWLTADFDLNGTVNLADLSQLAFHWEQTEAGAPPVPEPMTVGILLVGAAAVIRRRRR